MSVGNVVLVEYMDGLELCEGVEMPSEARERHSATCHFTRCASEEQRQLRAGGGIGDGNIVLI